MTSNRPEFVVAINGISKIGAAAVLLSPAWKAVETGHAVELTAPVHAVADGPAVELLGGLLGEDRITDLDHPEAITATVGADGPAPVAGTSDLDEVVLVFSSGTTGLPKAVRHTHRSMGYATADWCAALGLGPDDRFQVARRRRTSSGCSTCWPRRRPVPPCVCTGGSTSTRYCGASSPNG